MGNLRQKYIDEEWDKLLIKAEDLANSPDPYERAFYDALTRTSHCTFSNQEKKEPIRIIMEQKYDSTADTLLHIKKVNAYLCNAAIDLLQRGKVHDDSKLRYPEKDLFDEYTPKLAGCSYGSDEYKQYLSDLKPALDHHYLMNSHHPQFYVDGIDGMNLFDIMEMFFDWKAASERHDDGDIYNSIRINKDRFNMSDQLAQIFENTCKYMQWENKRFEP